MVASSESTGQKRRNAPRLVTGGLVGALLLGGGVYIGTRFDDVAPAPTASPILEAPEEETTPTETPPEEPSPTPTPEATKTAKPGESYNTAFGNLDLRYIGPDEPFITATRRNGELIKLPLLRDPTVDLRQAVSAALAHISGYITTGDQGILDAITKVDPVRNELMRRRDTFGSSDKEFQMLFFDIPASRALFDIEQVGVYKRVTLRNPGSIKFSRYSPSNAYRYRNTWQDPYLRNLVIDQPDEAEVLDYLGNLSLLFFHSGHNKYLLEGVEISFLQSEASKEIDRQAAEYENY